MQRHPPITLVCQQCGTEFKRRYSYHRFLVEKRGITLIYCSKRCKDIANIVDVPDSVIEEYQQGYTFLEIGLHHNISAETIRQRVIASGISIRSRNAHMLTDKNPTKGKGHTEASKEKIRAANHKQFDDPVNRELAAHNQRKAMIAGKFKASSKLEDKVAQELSNLGLAFIRQYGIRNPENGRYCACVDFMLANGTVIEVNGTYWHTDPRAYPDGPKDSIQKRHIEKYQKKLEIMGRLNIPVIELWEIDLRADMIGAIRTALNI